MMICDLKEYLIEGPSLNMTCFSATPKNYRFLVNTACCGAPNKTFIQLNLFYLFLDCTAGRILFVRVCESFGGFLPHSSCWLLHNCSPSMCPDRMIHPATKANTYLFHVAFNFQKIIYTEGRDTDNITIVMLDSYIEKYSPAYKFSFKLKLFQSNFI